MRPTVLDAIMLTYNVAVVLSGGYVATRFDAGERWLLLGVGLALGLFWTIYFRLSVLSRVIEHADLPPEEAASENAAPDPDERR